MEYKREELEQGITPALELLSQGNISLENAKKNIVEYISALLESNNISVVPSIHSKIVRSRNDINNLLDKLRKQKEKLLVEMERQDIEINDPFQKDYEENIYLLEKLNHFINNLYDHLDYGLIPAKNTEFGKWMFGEPSELDGEIK